MRVPAPPRGPEAPAEASQEPPERKPGDLSGDGSLADLKQQMELARLLFPDMREVPGEVVMAMADGGGFLQAYAAYRARETRRLRQENEELRRQRNHLAKDCGAPSPRPERRILRHNCGPYYCASPKNAPFPAPADGGKPKTDSPGPGIPVPCYKTPRPARGGGRQRDFEPLRARRAVRLWNAGSPRKRERTEALRRLPAHGQERAPRFPTLWAGRNDASPMSRERKEGILWQR